MKAYALLLAAFAGAAALASAAAAVRSFDEVAEGPIGGTWSAEPTTLKAAAGRGPFVELSLHRGRGSHTSTNQHPVALADLKGLTADQMAGDGTTVAFSLE